MTAALTLGLGGIVAAIILGAGWRGRPQVALCSSVALLATGANDALARSSGISLFRPVLVATVAVAAIEAARHRARLAWSPVLSGVAAVAAWSLASLAMPRSHSQVPVVFDRFLSFAAFAAWFVLFSTSRDLFAPFRWFTVVLAAGAGLSAVHAFALGGQGDLHGLSVVVKNTLQGVHSLRYAGFASDMNFWGRTLVLALPMGLSILLLPAARRRWQTALWLVPVLLLLIAVYLTRSRGTYGALVIVIAVWMFWAGRGARRSMLYLPAALVLVLTLTDAGRRLATIGSINAGSPTTVDQSLTDRARQTAAAWRMFQDQPLVGQGVGAFHLRFEDFDRYADATYRIGDAVQDHPGAHNFYAEQLAEGGLVGLAAWAFTLAAGLYVALRARLLVPVDAPSDRLLAAGLLSGLTGWVAASVFLHLSDLRSLLAVLAATAALDVRARAAGRQQATTGRHRVAHPAQARVARRVAGSAATILVALTLMIWQRAPSSYEAQALLPVQPSGGDPGTLAYDYDLLARGQIAPTFRAVVDGHHRSGLYRARGVTVTTRVSPQRGSLLLIVHGRDADRVRTSLDQAADAAVRRIAALDAGYVLERSTTTGPRRLPDRRWAEVLVLGGLTMTALLIAVVPTHRRAGTRRSVPEGATAR